MWYTLSVMDKEHVKSEIQNNYNRVLGMIKWILLSLTTGLTSGLIGAAFYYCIEKVTLYRTAHPAVLFLLPVGAVGILLLYHLFRNDEDEGTNIIIASIHSDAKIPLRQGPLIFLSTILSHLVGASVGREGAALQLGGSVGKFYGEVMELNDTDRRTMIMVGMAGVFSALIGTPMAAAIFAMEVISIGIMQYAALMPCVISAFTARAVASCLGCPAPSYKLESIPAFALVPVMKIVLLAIFCGLVSMGFCILLHRGERRVQKLLQNRYLRALLLGSAVLVLTLLFGDQTYNGAGTEFLDLCLQGEAPSGAFLWKILFTVLSILAGYKGGEILPSFFIGASLGSLFAALMGMDPGLCAAAGLCGVFCGVTNCPISSLLIGCELFGFSAAPYFLLVCAFSYLISGYFGIYTSQRIVYSKYHADYIDKKTL